MHYDYIIVGSGGAGLFTALLARRHGSVLVITKDAATECNTRYAQGGIAAALGPGDSPELHLQDTLVAGAGLCDEAAVRVLVEEGPARMLDLIRLGLPFDREGGTLALGREGAHGKARILHAGGDATGRQMELTLSRVAQEAGMEIWDQTLAVELLVERGTIQGVRVLDERTGRESDVSGRFVVLATGGAGQLYSHTTNPAVATGDGIALAYRAGAAIADLEFYQFHPTALSLPSAPRFLISEAVRGEGAILRTENGRAFMLDYDPRAELAPRDIVARAIVGEMERSGGPVYLDVTHIPADRIRRRFPTIAAFCGQHGIDITREAIPVAPAAHYYMGGVVTDLWGEATIRNLFAAGECARCGVHGANRLASNSMLELVVFGHRVVERTLVPPAERVPVAPHGLPAQSIALPSADSLLLSAARRSTDSWSGGIDATDTDSGGAVQTSAQVREELRGVLWRDAGIIRDAERLERARRRLATLERAVLAPRTRPDHETSNLLLIGRLLVEAALARTESRGAHTRQDFPAARDEWRCHLSYQLSAVSYQHPDSGNTPRIEHPGHVREQSLPAATATLKADR